MSRRFKHLTPRYIKNRIFVLYDEKANPGHPWLTRDSVKLLSQLLKPSDVGVEFGSGRSTKWFVSRLSRLTSIESSEEWYKRVKSENAEHIEAGKLIYRLAKERAEYVDTINTFDENSVDFCLIDGEFRGQCAVSMLPKIRPGGLLVVDNINWYIPCDSSHSPNSRRSHDGSKSELWRQFLSEVDNWRYIWTTNGVSDTGIWIRK